MLPPVTVGLDDPIEATAGDLPNAVFVEGVYRMASAMVGRAQRDAQRGNWAARIFLADWEGHFSSRGRVATHQEFSKN